MVKLDTQSNTSFPYLNPLGHIWLNIDPNMATPNMASIYLHVATSDLLMAPIL